MRQRLWVLLGVLFLSVSTGAFADKHQTKKGNLESVLKSQEIRIGVALYPPWAMQDEDGDLRGFEIDVGRQLAEDLGVKPKFVVMVWDDLLSSLMTGKVDIIASGFSITPDRALKVNFSQPYSSSGTGLATNLALTQDFESLTDLNRPTTEIAVVTGTLSERFARTSFPAAGFEAFKTSEDASQALIDGEVHAFVVANPVPRFISLRYPDKVDVPLDEPLRKTQEAFAIRKGDADFLAFLNAWITARDADLWLKGHHDFWFNSLKWRAQAER